MIDLGNKAYCICKKYNNTQDECIDAYTISEKGKTVCLLPNDSTEQALAIVIDQCVITGNDTKCDALFLFSSSNKKISFLTELKGAGDIPKAFSQLSYTRDKRAEYKDILEKFSIIDNRKVREKFIIVSNGILEKSKIEALENEYKIRVSQILYSEPTTPIPNLREYL